jgi:hypothetical protein
LIDEKKDEKNFIKCIMWVYKHHKTTFDKNLSMLLGIHNERIITDNELIKITKSDYNNHEIKLKKFIMIEYRNTFRKEFLSRVRNYYFKYIYIIPCYISINLIKKLQLIIINNFPEDTYTKYKIDHLCKTIKTKTNVKHNTFDQQYLWIKS